MAPATSPGSRPVELRTSKVIRLQRLYKDTVYKEEQRHLQLPVASAAESVSTIVAALRELIPPADEVDEA